jgi:hypothetical protein
MHLKTLLLGIFLVLVGDIASAEEGMEQQSSEGSTRTSACSEATTMSKIHRPNGARVVNSDCTCETTSKNGVEWFSCTARVWWKKE